MNLEKKLERKFISEIKKLSENYKVILLYPLPQSPSNVTQRIYNNYYINKNINFENDVINFDTIVFEKFNKDVIELFDKISSKNIHKIYPHKIFCNGQHVNFTIIKTYIFLMKRIHRILEVN